MELLQKFSIELIEGRVRKGNVSGFATWWFINGEDMAKAFAEPDNIASNILDTAYNSLYHNLFKNEGLKNYTLKEEFIEWFFDADGFGKYLAQNINPDLESIDKVHCDIKEFPECKLTVKTYPLMEMENNHKLKKR